MLYVFFWVIPRSLNFICRRFGTVCLFHLHRQVGKLFTYLPMKMEQSVPKRRPLKFRRRGTLCLLHLHRPMKMEQTECFLLGNSPTSEFICRRFGTLCLFHLHKQVDKLFTYFPMKMEQTECSETSAYKIQTPGNYPEENIQQTYFLSVCVLCGKQ